MTQEIEKEKKKLKKQKDALGKKNCNKSKSFLLTRLGGKQADNTVIITGRCWQRDQGAWGSFWVGI